MLIKFYLNVWLENIGYVSISPVITTTSSAYNVKTSMQEDSDSFGK